MWHFLVSSTLISIQLTTCICTYIGLHYQLHVCVLILAFIINYMCVYLHWPPLSTTFVCTYIGLHYQQHVYVLTLTSIINYMCMYLHWPPLSTTCS